MKIKDKTYDVLVKTEEGWVVHNSYKTENGATHKAEKLKETGFIVAVYCGEERIV